MVYLAYAMPDPTKAYEGVTEVIGPLQRTCDIVRSISKFTDSSVPGSPVSASVQLNLKVITPLLLCLASTLILFSAYKESEPNLIAIC